MKKIFTISLMCVCINLYSQTKKETEDFIKKYIEASPQNNGETSEKNDVAFKTTEEGDYLMIYSNYHRLGQMIYFFKPKDIQSITIDKTTMKGQNLVIKINMKYGTKAERIIPNLDDRKDSKDSFDIILGNTAFNDNIPERLKKALEHLSRLAGGGVTEDKF